MSRAPECTENYLVLLTVETARNPIFIYCIFFSMKYLSNSFETWYVCSTITCVHSGKINLNLNQYFIEKKYPKMSQNFRVACLKS